MKSGDRESIKVWSDPWILGTQSRKVLSLRLNSPTDLEVGALIDPITSAWNIRLIEQLFLPLERDRILTVPLRSRMPDDMLCWDLEKNGDYSVRSAYTIIFGDEWAKEEVTSLTPSTLWRKIWRATVLPRVKLFQWRACLEALLTRCDIRKRVKEYDGS